MMAESLVPYSSNNLPRGWIFRVIHSQNQELTLGTWAPESIKAVTFCHSTITAASLDCPARWAMESGFKNGTTGMAALRPVGWAAFMLAGLFLGSWWECEGSTIGLGGCQQWG